MCINLFEPNLKLLKTHFSHTDYPIIYSTERVKPQETCWHYFFSFAFRSAIPI